MLVSMMSAPASRYLVWISSTTSGRVMTRISLFPFRSCVWFLNLSPLKSSSLSLYCCTAVPMAPSITMILSSMILLITSNAAVGLTGSTHLAYLGTGAVGKEGEGREGGQSQKITFVKKASETVGTWGWPFGDAMTSASVRSSQP